MRLGEMLGWQDNPWYQMFDSNRSTISGAAAGAMANPANPWAGASQGVAQGIQQDQARTQMQEEEQQRAAQINQTAEFLRQAGDTQLADAVDGGMMPADKAFSMWYQRQNQPGPEPFTLGAGQVRYDGNGNPIASGPDQTPQTIINNSTGSTSAFYDQLDEDLAGQTSGLISAGMEAQSNNMRLGELQTLMQTAPQGMQGGMTQALGALGLPTEGLDETQAAQALINQMVPGQRPPGSGTMSDADLALFKASLPQIINQPGGNQLILQTMQAINEYTIAQARIAQQVANREITPARGRELQAQVPNPLAEMRAAPPPPAGGAVAPMAVNPQTGERVVWNGSSWVPAQ